MTQCVSIVNTVHNKGELAQSFNMLGNQTNNPLVPHHLRNQVGIMYHPAGLSHTIIENMSTHQRSAASDVHVSNIGLTMSAYVPQGT